MKSKVLLGFLAGAAIGAIAGILLAPDKGSETRKKISKKSHDIGDSLKRGFNDLVDNLKDSYASVKTEVEHMEDKVRSAANSIHS